MIHEYFMNMIPRIPYPSNEAARLPGEPGYLLIYKELLFPIQQSCTTIIFYRVSYRVLIGTIKIGISAPHASYGVHIDTLLVFRLQLQHPCLFSLQGHLAIHHCMHHTEGAVTWKVHRGPGVNGMIEPARTHDIIGHLAAAGCLRATC